MKNPCPYYRKCSGCSLLAVPYVKQLRDKQQDLRQLLAAGLGAAGAGRLDQLLAEPAASPLPLGYRASTKLALHMDAFGQRSIGLYQRGTKTVVDIPLCPVHAPALNQTIQRLFGQRAKIPAPFYQHNKRSFQPGLLKFATLRLSPDTGMLGLIVSHTGVDLELLRAWAKAVATPSLSIHACLLTKTNDDRILSDQAVHLAGPALFAFAIAGQHFALPPLAFFQANYSLMPAFVEAVAGGMAGHTLLDLYGGFGAYSWATKTPSGKGFAKIYLVDGNASAIAAAAAQADQLPGLTPVHASVEDFLARKLSALDAQQVTHVIVNPPRAGLSAKVKAALTPRQLPHLTQLIYASCNPQTLVRDLQGICASGRLKLTSIRAFDMFPQTEHIEVVAKLALC